MEYVSYILITIGLVIACFFLLRPPVNSLRKGGKEPVIQKPVTDPGLEAQKARAVFQRELQGVPTPWGWPGHHGPLTSRRKHPANSEEVHGVTESLHHFVERLFTEKDTVDSRDYLLRKDANLRTLVGDHFGRASTISEQTHQQGKLDGSFDAVSLLEQMDEYPVGKQKNDMTGVQKRPKELRTPWGW